MYVSVKPDLFYLESSMVSYKLALCSSCIVDIASDQGVHEDCVDRQVWSRPREPRKPCRHWNVGLSTDAGNMWRQ